MSKVFYNPYQFIPIDTRKIKQLTQWSPSKDQSAPLAREANKWVLHDYWHSQGLSGRIVCRLTTLSPMVVGSQQISQDNAPSVVQPYQHPSAQITIPTNSLRGLVGSVAEVLRQSSLRVLTDIPTGDYSNRKKAEQALQGKGHICNNRQLIQDKITKKLLPISSEVISILENMMRSLVENTPPNQRQQKQNDILHEWNINKPERGWKRNQDNTFDPLVLDGDLIFFREEHGEVVELSYSSIWRKAIAGDLFSAFARSSGENSLPWNKNRQALTPAEALFGVVEDQPDKHNKAVAI